LTAAALAGCAVLEPAPSTDQVAAFSANREGAVAPRGWQPLVITRAKAPTHYRLVYDEGASSVVVHARAERSATGLKQPLDVDAAARPRVAWRWRVQDLIAGADNLDRHAEDSPVRLLLFFDGDKGRLPARDHGQWKHFERDYVADYERAFGERPGRLIGIGIMTDTDNTGAEIEAFYGDIELRSAS
ncbi:MAG: hypothetical protein H6R03_698, partial [Burkholderiaceae bacterium]|nr:hypothetical protein [Burkholderiaceae bacterium]